VRISAALRPVSLELLASAGASAMVAPTESVGGAPTGLTDRKLRNLAGGRRHAADLRKRRANQRAMNRSFFLVAVVGVDGFIAFVGILRRGGL
jgi:hypothetical protein